MNDQAPEDHEVLAIIAQHVDDLITVVDRSGRRLYNSPAYDRLLGPGQVAIGQEAFSIVHPEDRQVANQVLREVLATGYASRGEYRFLLLDGSIRYIESQFTGIRNDRGEVERVIIVARDITSRKLFEFRLRDSEERFRQIAESIAEVFWMTDSRRTQIIYVSPAFEAIWGRSVDQLYLDPRIYYSFIHVEDRERVVAAVKAQNWQNFLQEYRILRPDGSVRWIREKAFPILTDDGHVYRVTGILADITKEKDAEAQILKDNHQLEEMVANRTSELIDLVRRMENEIAERRRIDEMLQITSERLRLLIDTANDAIVTIDDAGLVLDWNRQAEATFGYSRAEALGVDLAELIIPPEHHAAHRAGMRRFLSTRLSEMLNRRVEVEAMDRQRRRIPVEISIWPVPTGDGFTFSAFLRDISERKRLEHDLMRGLWEREAILETTQVGLAMTVNHRHVWVNSRLERMLGFEKGQLIGMSSEEHFADPANWKQLGDSAYPRLALGESYVAELQLQRADDSVFWCQVSGRAIDPSELERGIIWSFVDISDRKRAEEEVRRALAREKELGDLKSRFVSMTSHEFRTPLSTILSSTELVEHYSDQMPKEERAEVFQSIHTSIKRMASMLDDILVIGRADAGSIEVRLKPMLLRDFCAALVHELELACERSHSVNFEFLSENREYYLDDKLVRHILNNLLSNAVKYSPRGSVVNFIVEVSGDDMACFVVEDHGIGIPLEDQDKLFENFHRGANVGNVQGTGLGLAIVKRSVDLLGGRISVDSQMGHGTRFTVSLPLYRELPDEFDVIS